MGLSQCPICGGQDLTECFALHDLPVFVNVTAESREEALHTPVGQLSIVQCMHCGFVFNADFRPELVAYCQGYSSGNRLWDRRISSDIAQEYWTEPVFVGGGSQCANSPGGQDQI